MAASHVRVSRCARRAAGTFVLEQLDDEVRAESKPGEPEPRARDVDVRLRPVATVGQTRYLRRVERAEPVELGAAEHAGVERDGLVEVGDRQRRMVDAPEAGQ